MKNFSKTKLSQLSNAIINQKQQLKIKGGTEEVPDFIVDDMIDV